MTFDQESGGLHCANTADPTTQAADVRRLREAGPGPRAQHSMHRDEAIEPDESYSTVTKGSRVIALANLFVAIEAFVDRNYPGLTLSDLRALAASEAGLAETPLRENGRE